MKFPLTPEEAQRPALAVAKHYIRRNMRVKVEVSAWPDAPCRTTIVAMKSGLHILVEAQGTLNYSGAIKALADWLASRRCYAELYLATMEDATFQAKMLADMKKDGVGLLVVDEEGHVSESHKARNPALVVTPEPTLTYGDCKAEVVAAVQKFNETDRKDGLRDMCELVEGQTLALAVRAARKGSLVKDEATINDMKWSDQINMLSSGNSYKTGHRPIVTATLKDDLHSFRNARNLVDHKVAKKRDDRKRQMQFAERMMQGPRLVAELGSLRRKIK